MVMIYFDLLQYCLNTNHDLYFLVKYDTSTSLLFRPPTVHYFFGKFSFSPLVASKNAPELFGSFRDSVGESRMF